jgi:hypothetical protein
MNVLLNAESQMAGFVNVQKKLGTPAHRALCPALCLAHEHSTRPPFRG